MHPILSDRHKLASYLLAWLIAGVLIAKLLVVEQLTSWNTALLFSLPVTVIYGFIASSAYYVCRAQPVAGRRLFAALALFACAPLVAGSLWLALCLGWNNLATSLQWWTINFTQRSIALLFSAGCCCYLMSMLLHDLLIAADNLRKAELNAAQSLVFARESELQMLRAQINPHFLFNSLNSISALTSINAQSARSMTISLAQFYRLSLTLAEQKTIPLTQEIELCSSFLEVEKTRFGSKLQYEFLIDPNTEQAHIPPMLLQPLIENAIKHGIRDLPDGGIIRLNSQINESWLHIFIENPCEPQPTETIGNGLGLVNTRRRLQQLYGHQVRINWVKNPQLFRVEITLPLQLHPTKDSS